MLLPAYTKFLESFGVQRSMTHAGAASRDALRLEDGHVPGDGDPEDEGPEDGVAPGQQETPETRKGNEKHRSEAGDWLQEKPLHVMSATRLIMEPLRSLLDNYLHCSGDGWEQKQRAIAARHLQNPALPKRLYRLSLLADQVFEKQFFQDL